MTTKNSDRIVDRVELAKFLNVDPDYTSVLAREGLPKLHHGRYSLIRAMSWYIKHLQESLKKRGLRVPGDLNERDAKLRMMRAAAELKELELARERRELIPAPDVEKRWTDIVAVTKARLLAIGTRVSPKLAGETDRGKIQRVVDDEIREALFALARDGARDVNSSGQEHASVSAE